MAEFKFNCPQCGQTIEADETYRGQTAECPYCGKGIVVPRDNPKLNHPKVAMSYSGKPKPSFDRQVVQVRCPYCGAAYEVERAKYGKQMKCGTCGKSFMTGADNSMPNTSVSEAPTNTKSAGNKGSIRAIYGKIISYSTSLWPTILILAIIGNAIFKDDIQFFIGSLYDSGKWMPEDKGKAVNCWLNAAENGHIEAQYAIGNCYYNGEGVEQNMSEAVKWYRKAAEQGHAEAQYVLGKWYYNGCYYNGKGVRQNKSMAVHWWRKAAAQGQPDAKDMLRKIESDR